jgi:hypothetical protein
VQHCNLTTARREVGKQHMRLDGWVRFTDFEKENEFLTWIVFEARKGLASSRPQPEMRQLRR